MSDCNSCGGSGRLLSNLDLAEIAQASQDGADLIRDRAQLCVCRVCCDVCGDEQPLTAVEFDVHGTACCLECQAA